MKRSAGILLAVSVAAAWTCGAKRGAPVLERRTERGPVQALVRVAPSEPRIGDPITLELEVHAEPDVELLMPEFGEALDRFSIVDFVPSEAVEDDGGTVARQRYTLQPSRSGSQSIPPLLIEFIDRRAGRVPAPEGEDAYELLTERVEFEVSAALPEDAPLELRPALGELPPLPSSGAARWPLVLGALAVAGALAPFAVRSWRRRQARRQRRSAYELARAELEELLAAPRPRVDQMGPFYVKLSNIVRRYLENRFGLRSPELTTEEFLEVLTRSPDLSREHQDLLQDFLRQADLVKFAHHVPEGGDVEKSVRAARRFLDETRDDLAREEAPGAAPESSDGEAARA